MSSTGAAAGGSGGLSTLSTSLLVAACTTVVAAAVFVLFALRRYLKAKKRKSLMIASSPASATATTIYSSYKKAKSISTEDVSEPRLNFAPERAHNAQHDLRKTSFEQKPVASIPRPGFFPAKPLASPKFPKAALLSPRMQHPVSAEMPSPRTPCTPCTPCTPRTPRTLRTPKSPGLTELTMSPGPSILLKPMTYGKSPKLPSPSKSSILEKKESPEPKKKLTRSAVPSMLLRSLGVLPDLLANSSQSVLLQEEKETLADEKDQPDQEAKDAQEPSLTPILDLGIDFGNDESFEQSLKLRGDFSFDQGIDACVGSSEPTNKLDAPRNTQKSTGLQRLIEALSPAQPETTTLPVFKTSPPAKSTALPSARFARYHIPTPPPSAGLPPAPTSAPMYKTSANSSLQSKASQAIAAGGKASSTNSAVPDSFHSATGSIGQICIDMPPIDAAPSPLLDVDHEREGPSFRPLSLGLGPARSPSQGTFSNILGNLRKVPSRSDDVDLEAANSSIDDSSTSRSYSSDAISYSSSQTSVDIEANTSFGKANIVPAASVPPLPPMPVSLLKLAEDRTPQAQATPVFENETVSANTEIEAPRQPRKRASTLGALDRPKFIIPDLLHPRAAPSPPSEGKSAKVTEPTIHVESIEVNRASLMNLKAKSSDYLPLHSTGKGAAMNFMSPYHRTFIPDPPMDGVHLSPGLGADSPILAQLSPKMRGSSPSASPKPGFTESLKARLSLSRKSLTSSPGFTSRNSTPRLSTINQFPKPNGEGFQNFTEGGIVTSTDVAESSNAADATPKMKSSKPIKAAQRPATSPLVGQQAKGAGLGFSPAILFNGQEIEPTKPLRFKKPTSAVGRLGGLPHSVISPASPSPLLHTEPWDKTADGGASPSEALFSPLIAEGDNAVSPSGERIEFGMAQSSACNTPVAPTSSDHDLPSVSAQNSPQIDETTPRPDSADAGALADEEQELEHMSYRDSMISVAASTVSMMSNSTCMSDTMGEDLDAAAERRSKLLASVQQNLAKAKAKEAKRDSHAANRYRKSQISQTSSLRNIPEEVAGGVQTMGLGLFESEEENEPDEETETLEDSPKNASGGYGHKKPNNLVLMPHHDSRLIGLLTPPLTPVDGTALQKQSRHAATPSTSSASSASSAASVPRRVRPSRGGLAPIDVNAANRLSPGPDHRDGASSPSSLKLRPLSLAASLHGGDGSPMKRFERPAFSPALSTNILSPNPVHVASLNERSARHNEEGRTSRSITYRQGGVLPTISSKGALDTGRAGHAEPSLTHSDSTASMGSIASSLGSFSRMGQFPSPVRSSFVNNGLGKAMGMRSAMGSRGSVMSDLPNSTSIQSFASSAGGRLGYKTSDLSVAGI